MNIRRRIYLPKKFDKVPNMPDSLDGFTPRLGVDEKLILRLHIWGYRIVIYKARRR